MTPPAVYLDYNAGAPVRPEVAEAVAEALAGQANPSSVHRFGRLARRAVEDARERVAELVGAAPEAVVFTGGGSEANNLALKGAGRGRLVISAIEHDSVLNAAPGAVRVAAGRDGIVDLAALRKALAADGPPALVSLMLANNETGVIQPVAEAAELARGHGALLHCDAVQAAGRIVIDAASLGADLLTLSAHKIGGPQGVGALVVAGHVPLAPLIEGGRQETGRRAGTENVSGIVGFGVAAELAAADLVGSDGIARLRDGMEQAIRAVAPGVEPIGGSVARLANTSCIAMPGVSSETQVMAFDLAGVAVSAGAACSSGKITRSHVLKAMGLPRAEAESAIRISLGRASTAADCQRLVEAWSALHTRTRDRAATDGALSPAG